MIHELADVRTPYIGENTDIWQYVIVLPKARIGSNCNINCHCFIENDVVIGNNVTIKSGVYVWDGLRIQDNVFIGPNVTFSNDLFPRSKMHDHPLVSTIIKEGASIGAGSVIVAGIMIGQYALIGAGSVVTKSIGNNELWYGNPARFHGYVCNCGFKLDDTLKCQECGRKYALYNGSLEEIKN